MKIIGDNRYRSAESPSSLADFNPRRSAGRNEMHFRDANVTAIDADCIVWHCVLSNIGESNRITDCLFPRIVWST